LVKALRKAGANNLETANLYLDQVFLPLWRKRFRREPASSVNAHRPLGEALDLKSILSHVEKRRVTNDYTGSWKGKFYRIPREAVRPRLRSEWVRVEGRLDGTVWARIGGHAVQMIRAEPSLPTLSLRVPASVHKDDNRGGKSAWMKNFELGKLRVRQWEEAVTRTD
jgi:hypothetical protein